MARVFLVTEFGISHGRSSVEEGGEILLGKSWECETIVQMLLIESCDRSESKGRHSLKKLLTFWAHGAGSKLYLYLRTIMLNAPKAIRQGRIWMLNVHKLYRWRDCQEAATTDRRTTIFRESYTSTLWQESHKSQAIAKATIFLAKHAIDARPFLASEKRGISASFGAGI